MEVEDQRQRSLTVIRWRDVQNVLAVEAARDEGLVRGSRVVRPTRIAGCLSERRGRVDSEKSNRQSGSDPECQER
jgi:hypothetical protein